MVKVNGKAIPSPSTFTWGLQDISGTQAGRDMSDYMHKCRTSQKRKISLGWNGPNPNAVSAILKAFNPEYFTFTYPDAMSGQIETRTFYCGDRSAPIKIWNSGKKLYTSVTFDIIER